ncbi:Nn.00g071610.m01.CDS01 [Neocucurbitaria sp. VM-36]
MNDELIALRDGYPGLAAWIARDPDSETFVFRKFDRLAARNILHLQARLVALERDIDQQDEAARRSRDYEARDSSRRWETLVRCSKDSDRQEMKRMETFEELRKLLKEYYKDGNPVPLITGRADAFLDDEDDLLAVAKPIDEDYLSRALQNNWLFKKRKTADPFDRTYIHKNSHIVQTVAALDLMLAAILLIGAIVNLYFVTAQKAKLGLIALYTILFASSVALCTNARRAEIFAATAAYAAVLVVFVSGELGGGRSEQCMIQLEGAVWKTVRCPD